VVDDMDDENNYSGISDFQSRGLFLIASDDVPQIRKAVIFIFHKKI
jgi:hypothetical protein